MTASYSEGQGPEAGTETCHPHPSRTNGVADGRLPRERMGERSRHLAPSSVSAQAARPGAPRPGEALRRGRPSVGGRPPSGEALRLGRPSAPLLPKAARSLRSVCRPALSVASAPRSCAARLKERRVRWQFLKAWGLHAGPRCRLPLKNGNSWPPLCGPEPKLSLWVDSCSPPLRGCL